MLIPVNTPFCDIGSARGRTQFALECERGAGDTVRQALANVAASAMTAAPVPMRILNASGQRNVLMRVHALRGTIVRTPCDCVLDHAQWSGLLLSPDAIGFLVYRSLAGDQLLPTAADERSDTLMGWRVEAGRIVMGYCEIGAADQWCARDADSDTWLAHTLTSPPAESAREHVHEGYARQIRCTWQAVERQDLAFFLT